MGDVQHEIINDKNVKYCPINSEMFMFSLLYYIAKK